ncbi:carbohydrate-binding protein [Paenibacillus gorillae]|uniref:carbohydrate-binding protein n=1 Tax=Paenibacillus gorillae TaxID=1243662 RepID=UPI0004B9DB06|nr:carbohydrate-binding protein [Paenibacillus gorillae]
MRLNRQRWTRYFAALLIVIGISFVIYRIAVPGQTKEEIPVVQNESVEEESSPMPETAEVVYAYEAQDPANTLKGPHTNIADCAPCSGGKQVGGLFEGGSVQFNGVEVPEAGDYVVTIHYISGDPRSFYVGVNGGESEKYDLPAVAKDDWESVGTYDVAVKLNAGNNVLLFSDGDWYSPNLDRIVLKKAPNVTEGQNPRTVWGDSGNIGEQVSAQDYGSIKVVQHANGLTIDNGAYQILYNTSNGLAAYSWNGRIIAKGVYSSFKQDDKLLNSYEYDAHQLLLDGIVPVEDGHGKGIKLTIRNEKEGLPSFDQHYYIYEKIGYFVTEEEVSGNEPLSSNYMAPVVLDTEGGVDIGQYEDNRVLIVPFDNDAFARFASKTINTNLNTERNISSEVTAVFDNVSRNGLIMGSVTHDTWKTGIHWSGSDDRLNKLQVYGGFTSKSVTYDTLEHGKISGAKLRSPQVFVGFYNDYRDGMEEYGRANAAVAPPLSFGSNLPKGVPVGWNSWGAYAEHLSYDKMIDVSNFFHKHIQNSSFNNEGNIYINMDSFWDNLTHEQIKDVVSTIHKNGQKAGSYHTPFVYWGKNFLQEVEGTNGKYTYGDIALKDSEGKIVPYQMGIALDPTHPGTKMKIDHDIAKFKADGFEFLKLDFLTHATLEGEHYNKNAQTGIQAYNEGMAYLLEQLDGTMFISASIAPIFPSQYAHSRRISCDIDGSIGTTEYQLNSLTYGWWQNGTIYPYTDPDYMTLEKGETFEGSQTRVNAAVISGTVYFSSDDVNKPESQKLMKQLLTNPRINELAVKGKAFRTVEGNTGAAASDTYVLEDNGTYYLAVFNFSKDGAEKTVDLARAGISGNYKISDMWTDKSVQAAEGKLKLSLVGRESKLYQITF